MRLAIILGFLYAGAVSLGDVTLAWDANTEPDVVGYRLYYSTESGQYSTNHMIEVLGVNTTQVKVPSSRLVIGRTNYFAVTAFNASGLESDPSNEVAWANNSVPSIVKHAVIKK